MTIYKNPWFKPFGGSGPEFYITEAKPREYRGHLVYNRIPGKPGHGVWDIVKDGVCLTQRAGDTNNGLNAIIDGIIDGTEHAGAWL